jgi:pilus assembly protein Flp/PilA
MIEWGRQAAEGVKSSPHHPRSLFVAWRDRPGQCDLGGSKWWTAFPAFPGKEVSRSAWLAKCLSDPQPGKGDSVMSKLIAGVRQFLHDENGPTAVEYAVMLALIVVVCIAAITTLGSNAENTFNNVALNAAASGS